MREWSFWEWSGFIALWITVALSAIDQALKLMPELAKHIEPAPMLGRMAFRAFFAFVPLVLLIFSTTILAVKSFTFHEAEKTSPIVSARPAPPVTAPSPHINPTPPDVSENRIFVHHTPYQLHEMLEGKMRSEQSLITSPFIGKWIKLTLIVDDVSIFPGFGEIFSGSVLKGNKLVLVFDKDWIARLELLTKGDAFNATCKITDLNDLFLSFEECELK